MEYEESDFKKNMDIKTIKPIKKKLAKLRAELRILPVNSSI